MTYIATMSSTTSEEIWKGAKERRHKHRRNHHTTVYVPSSASSASRSRTLRTPESRGGREFRCMQHVARPCNMLQVPSQTLGLTL